MRSDIVNKVVMASLSLGWEFGGREGEKMKDRRRDE
jgi:hypothetical protein